ncbi:hypothetical protein [Curtobacterium sp. MCPF17_052]|uniref:hypothetical protein n=1 Tax=Curtobacterium sp. MCPF17_052 TaxID=2175655 RepID=UPI0024DF97D3|nr:hypothetical protein [Curtobacterium sp. MCPF17_052]WIB14088.1 hypothetical protein DEJ36_07190 [Curtobacterium sp. MCPF17_052]
MDVPDPRHGHQIVQFCRRALVASALEFGLEHEAHFHHVRLRIELDDGSAGGAGMSGCECTLREDEGELPRCPRSRP